MSVLIDKAAEYIEAKDARYLAKEGLIVYYMSATGRKSDQVWVKHSMAETIRIIRATRLTTDCELRDHHVLAAFQELERVYEYGMSSRYGVAEGIFNYFEHSGASLSNQVATKLLEELQMNSFNAILLQDLHKMHDIILNKLGSDESVTDCRQVLQSVLESSGYEYRLGSRRPNYQGCKMSAAMMLGTKPRDIVDARLPNQTVSSIIRRVHGELK